MQDKEPDVWSSPDSSVTTEASGNSVSKVVAAVGSAIALLPVPLLAITAISLVLDYESMIVTAEGDPAVLSGLLSQKLVPLLLSLLIGLFGFFLAICSASFGTYKSRWFFWALVVSALIYFVAFPIGTLMSLTAVFLVLRHKSRFLE